LNQRGSTKRKSQGERRQKEKNFDERKLSRTKNLLHLPLRKTKRAKAAGRATILIQHPPTAKHQELIKEQKRKAYHLKKNP